MTNLKNRLSISRWILLFLLMSYSHMTSAQCAGTDGTTTVCNKDADTANRNFDLATVLNGTPAPGGTWTTNNPANFFALDRTTGIVDLWRINNSGIHQFIYTNDACGQSATATINLGGYPGENNIDGSANACSDNSAVNLQGFLGSEIDGKVQDFNGLWEEVPVGATNLLNDNEFNAQLAGPGVYNFTYTVPAVGTCASRTARVELEVHPAANPGVPSILTVCTDDDLSSFTNVDLNGLLTGEDDNGTWSEGVTNQLSSLSDSTINVEEINDNFGFGTYNFTYTVFPTHPVCEERSSVVSIAILPTMEGTMDSPNFCIGSPYEINLTYDETMFPNGGYEITYRLDNDTALTAVDNVNFSDGTGIITIDSGIVATNRFVSLDIIGIQGTSPIRDICPAINIPPTTFLVVDATVAVADVCLDTNASVVISNILDTAANFSNETYAIAYTITYPDATTSSFNAADVLFADGEATFDIPAENLRTSGDYNVSISIPDSFPLDCNLNSDFTLTAPPSQIFLDIVVDNSCDANNIDVIVDAPILADGSYTVTYEVTELNATTALISNTINFNGGTANYDLDIATLSMGNYTVVLRSTQNDTTACRTEFDFELQENFAIGGTPELPQAEASQTFCLNDFSPESPTLSDIEVTASGTLSFFATETDSDNLPETTVLADGEDYFITSTDPNNNCESSERIRIQVSLVRPDTAVTADANPTFCASEAAMVMNLEVTAPNGGMIVWYDAATGGNSIADSELLVDGISYYAAEQLEGSCESESRLEITPVVISPERPNLASENLALCGLDNPTVAALRSLENNTTSIISWYSVEDGGTPLLDSELLTNATYFAESEDLDTGCIDTNRVAVSVDLTSCDPEDYDFFIPDGFSPNNDGSNDTFFIPNIAVIFPDFTLEIMNRYGSSIFKGDINNPAWDGTNQNSIAPNGVYFYIINYNKEGFSPIQGRLYLNR